MEGTPLSGAPCFRLKRSDHRKAGSSGPGQQQREANPLQRKSPFPAGEAPHCRAFVHPETPFPAGMEGTPLSGAPCFRLKRSDHRKAGSSGPGQQQREANPLQRKSPFPSGDGSALRSVRPPGNALSCRDGGDAPVWERPASGLNAQIIGRPDLLAHGQQQREANPLQWKSPFPSGEDSALRGVRPPGNALSCRGEGDAPVWSAPLPA